MEQLNGKAPVRRRSKAQLLELLGEFDRGAGMTVKAFCRHHKISEGAFYSARKHYGSPRKIQKMKARFIEIAPAVANQSAGGLFAEAKGIKLYQAVSAEYLKALIS